MTLKNVSSVGIELLDIVESYKAGDITPERAMEFVEKLISPAFLTNEIIIRTVAFFWNVEPKELVNEDKRGKKDGISLPRHMLRYFLMCKHDNKQLAARLTGVSVASVYGSINVHNNLLNSDKNYKGIFLIVSRVLNL